MFNELNGFLFMTLCSFLQNDGQVLTIGPDMGSVHAAVSTIEGLPSVTGDAALGERVLVEGEVGEDGDHPNSSQVSGGSLTAVAPLNNIITIFFFFSFFFFQKTSSGNP